VSRQQHQVTYEEMAWLRQLVDDGPGDVPEPECGALLRCGLIARGGRADGAFDATAAGRQMVAGHVQRTGDGPEALKGLFAKTFGGGR
jgi:hypothetical protein